jgi:hypothetical protein
MIFELALKSTITHSTSPGGSMDTAMEKTFDRAAEDIGNSVWLEHINVTAPDQVNATLFYISGMGFTRDPYIMTGLENMWVNIGRSQVHLPVKTAQVLRGHTGIVQADRKALLKRLDYVKPKLASTKFGYTEYEDYVETTCPWGNKFRVYEPDVKRFGGIVLGMPYVEFTVPKGTADGIARFYSQVIKAPSNVVEDEDGRAARVKVGQGQHLVFRETDKPLAEYDGHHLQIYISDFSSPHRWLKEKGLITEESDQYQYRFKDIVDPDNGKFLFTIEHEVRSITHPLYARPLVNRNPVQNNRNYRPGYDAGVWATPHEI